MDLKNNIIIREYKSQDYPQIIKLWKETGLGDPQRGDNQEVIEKTLSKGAKFIVIEYKPNAQIIGTAWLTTDFRRIYLHHFGIAKEFQGQGLANLLMKKCTEYIKNMGLQVKLEVHKTNIKAINLYKKWGFKTLGDYFVMIVRDVKNVFK